MLNSPAVVIGAMLISPLAAADLYLGIKSLLIRLLSVFTAIFFSGVLVWLLPFHSLLRCNRNRRSSPLTPYLQIESQGSPEQNGRLVNLHRVAFANLHLPRRTGTG